MKIFVSDTKLVFGDQFEFPVISLDLKDEKTFVAFMKAVSLARKNVDKNQYSVFGDSINTVDKAEAFVQECMKIMQDAAMSAKKE